MALDADLRKQLEEAREVLLAEIEELECRKTGCSLPAYAEIKRQLNEIDEIFEQNEEG